MSSRQDRLDKEALQEQRRLGLAPLARDAVTDKELGANVPEMFTDAGWVHGHTKGQATLQHQRIKEEDRRGDQTELQDKVIAAKKQGQQSGGAPGSSNSQQDKGKKPKLGGLLGSLRTVGKKDTKPVAGTQRTTAAVPTVGGVAGAKQLAVAGAGAGKALSFEEKNDRWAGANSGDKLLEIQKRKLVEQGIAVDDDGEEDIVAGDDDGEGPPKKRQRLESGNKAGDPYHSERALVGTALRATGSVPVYLQTDNAIDAGTAVYDARSGALLSDEVKKDTGIAQVDEQRIFLYKKIQAKEKEAARLRLAELAGPDSGIEVKKSEKGATARDTDVSGQSKLLAHGSMFLPTANAEEFKLFQDRGKVEEKALRANVAELYGNDGTVEGGGNSKENDNSDDDSLASDEEVVMLS